MASKINVDPEDLEEFGDEINAAQKRTSNRINADPEKVEQGLAKLVLTLIELIRRLLEQQALRRIENGTLTEEEIERLGNTFVLLETKMEELTQVFGLDAEDLNIDLGPLGNLI